MRSNDSSHQWYALELHSIKANALYEGAQSPAWKEGQKVFGIDLEIWLTVYIHWLKQKMERLLQEWKNEEQIDFATLGNNVKGRRIYRLN